MLGGKFYVGFDVSHIIEILTSISSISLRIVSYLINSVPSLVPTFNLFNCFALEILSDLTRPYLQLIRYFFDSSLFVEIRSQVILKCVLWYICLDN